MATSDDRLWKLHLRKALGELLAPKEQADLDAWYAEQDQAEALSLGVALESIDLGPLKQQVDAILGRIVTTTQTIQTIAEENETLRRENLVLSQQLAQRKVLQPGAPGFDSPLAGV